MDKKPETEQPRRSRLRALVAVIIGLVGAAIIWVASPYNTVVMGGQYIADSYLPVAAFFLTLILVLAVNPALRKFLPRLALTMSQLALVISIMLMASVLPASGLLRMLPYSLAQVPLDVRNDKKVARAYKEMDLPPSLFPDKIGYKEEVPAAEHFIRELPPDESIPWRAWLPPLVSWGSSWSAAG